MTFRLGGGRSIRLSYQGGKAERLGFERMFHPVSNPSPRRMLVRCEPHRSRFGRTTSVEPRRSNHVGRTTSVEPRRPMATRKS